MRHGSRMIKVDKLALITKIKENKVTHLKEYESAVIAYKEEALKQLMHLKSKADSGDLMLTLNLTTPINNSDNYDKIIEMFEWEVSDTVELEQKEFTEYVQDETSFAMTAKFSNKAYL